MNRATIWAATAALTLLLCARAPVAQAQDTVRCESSGGQYRSCAVDTRGGVRVARQLSSQGCWENDTWGYDRNRIWVTNGCRADFTVGDDRASGHSSGNGNAVAVAAVVALLGAAVIAGSNKHDSNDSNRNDNSNAYYDNNRYTNNNGGNRYDGDTFRCESTGNRYISCRMPARGEVEIRRQLSSTPCQYGSTWGTEGGSVWVDKGCRADFAVY